MSSRDGMQGRTGTARTATATATRRAWGLAAPARLCAVLAMMLCLLALAGPGGAAPDMTLQAGMAAAGASGLTEGAGLKAPVPVGSGMLRAAIHRAEASAGDAHPRGCAGGPERDADGGMDCCPAACHHATLPVAATVAPWRSRSVSALPRRRPAGTAAAPPHPPPKA